MFLYCFNAFYQLVMGTYHCGGTHYETRLKELWTLKLSGYYNRQTLQTARMTGLEANIPVFCGRGRNAGYPAPPAQIPACGNTALGSYLGC